VVPGAGAHHDPEEHVVLPLPLLEGEVVAFEVGAVVVLEGLVVGALVVLEGLVVGALVVLEGLVVGAVVFFEVGAAVGFDTGAEVAAVAALHEAAEEDHLTESPFFTVKVKEYDAPTSMSPTESGIEYSSSDTLKPEIDLRESEGVSITFERGAVPTLVMVPVYV